MEDKSSKYLEWVDWAKAIGVFLMVLGHGDLVDAEIRQFIYAFHMPLFFILSGFLYKKRTFSEELKRNFNTLLVPYFIMNGTLLLLYSLIDLFIGKITVLNILSNLGAIVLGLGYNTEYLIPVSTPLWFLYALFIIQMIVALGSTRFVRYFIMLLAVGMTIFLKQCSIDTLVPIDSAMLALPFFIFGQEFKKIIIKKFSVYLLPILLLILVLINYYNGRVDINTCKYGNSLLLAYLGGICGTLLIVGISRYIKGRIKRYVSGLLLVVGYNLLAIIMAKKIWNIIFPNIEMSNLVGIVIALFICFAFVPIIDFSKRYFRIIIGNR